MPRGPTGELGAPKRVLKLILRNKVAHLFINLWSATETTAFPSPEWRRSPMRAILH